MQVTVSTAPKEIENPSDWIRGIAATVAALSIGLAIHQHDGEYEPGAMGLVTIALVAATVAVLGLRRVQALPRGPQFLVPTLCVALIQFFQLYKTWPAGVDQQIVSQPNRIIYLVRLTVAAVFLLIGIAQIPFLRRWWFVGLIAAHLWLSIWMIRSSPDPHIDVWVFQQHGPEALLHGRNPYVAEQVRFPDIYHSTRPGAQAVYGPGMSKDDVLQFGFPYPPISLLFSTLGYWLGGDCRYAQAVALAITGLCLGFARQGLISKLAAAVLLFTPRIFFILGRAWTEPFVVMLLAATIFLACRKSRFAPFMLGVFLASKQYLIFAVPLTFLLLDEPFDFRLPRFWLNWGMLLAKAAIAGAIVTLPLALWDWRAFWFSAFTVQQIAPFRWDALSYLVWLSLHNSYYTRWVWLAFVAVIVALAISMWKAPRNPFGFAAAITLVFLAFFAFNKQAFCNYYFFTIGAACIAVATMPSAKVRA